jgi:hypothetical protein
VFKDFEVNADALPEARRRSVSLPRRIPAEDRYRLPPPEQWFTVVETVGKVRHETNNHYM